MIATQSVAIILFGFKIQRNTLRLMYSYRRQVYEDKIKSQEENGGASRRHSLLGF
jgi:hypothetical protein